MGRAGMKWNGIEWNGMEWNGMNKSGVGGMDGMKTMK